VPNAAIDSVMFFRRTGKLDEAVQIALGKKKCPKLEDIGTQIPQSQTWFFPDQDKLNRFQLMLQNQLQIAPENIADADNGSQSGYAVTVTGNFSEQDIASIAGPLLGQRLDNLPASPAV